MKILSITAGAASMYCGSCLRDNALASELISQGHDVVLLPLYTPTLTDEPNVSNPHVFFGGISIYLEQKFPFFRRTPRLLDRLWDSRWALRLAARSSIPTSPKMLGELTVSMLKGESGYHAKELAKLLDWLRHEPAPELVSLPYTLLIALAQPLKAVLRRPVCCTLQGEDLFLNGLEEPYRSQSLDLIRAHVRHVDAFLPVSEYCAAFMSDYLGIPRSKMHVTPLGINLHGFEPGFKFKTNCFTVGFLARVAPEKGLHNLCQAYRWLRQNTAFAGATLEAAGYLAPEHVPYLRGIEKQMKEWGLGHEFQYRGALDRQQKIEFLRNLDVLSVPGDYQEPKGIPLLEAMAVGVPVVQPRRGAFPEIVERAGGGLIADNIAEGILALWKDRSLAEELGRKGAEGVREHYSVARMAARTLEVYRSLAGGKTAALSPS